MAIKASNTDDLTGVANRHFVTARMEEMLQRSDAAGCVCLLDLDNFKYINDRFGTKPVTSFCVTSRRGYRAKCGVPIVSAASAAKSFCWCCRTRQRPRRS